MRRNQDHLMPRGAVSGTIGAAGYSFAQWLDLRGPNGLETQGDLEPKNSVGALRTDCENTAAGRAATRISLKFRV